MEQFRLNDHELAAKKEASVSKNLEAGRISMKLDAREARLAKRRVALDALEARLTEERTNVSLCVCLRAAAQLIFIQMEILHNRLDDRLVMVERFQASLLADKAALTKKKQGNPRIWLMISLHLTHLYGVEFLAEQVAFRKELEAADARCCFVWMWGRRVGGGTLDW